MTDDTIYNELRVIRSRIESIEKTQEVLVRAERERILAELLPSFEGDLTLCRVYLLVDGARGQRQIAAQLGAAGAVGASEATVSRKLDALRDLDLIELVDRTTAGNIYRKAPVDRLLRLTRQVQQIVDRPRGR
jgi:DNA-binding transcriptional ArsR family regulator